MNMKKIAKSMGIVRMRTAASKLLETQIDEYVKKIITKASSYQKHAGRKTMTEEDIKLAITN